MNLAAFYCSKRETSRAKLGQYLLRKCRENNIDDALSSQWIPAILDDCQQIRLVDDKRYTEILIRDYTSRGKGFKYIEQKLKEKGIPKELQMIPRDLDEEFERALKLGRKTIAGAKNKVDRKLSRSNDPRKNPIFELKQKLLQKLVSSGFALDLSRKVIDQIIDETSS